MKDNNLHEKMVAGKQAAMKLKDINNIPSPLKAIRDMCKDCVGSAAEVKICGVEKCPVWAYRLGRSPKETDLKVPEFDQFGNEIGYHDYSGYRY